MNEVILSGLADNSMITESDDTSKILPSKRRVNSVKARKCSEVSLSFLDAALTS